MEDAFLGLKLIRLNNLWPFKFLSSQILFVSLNHLFISFWNLNFSLNSAVCSCKSRPLSVVHALPKLPAAFCSTCISCCELSPLAVHTCSPFLSFHVCSASTWNVLSPSLFDFILQSSTEMSPLLPRYFPLLSWAPCSFTVFLSTCIFKSSAL